MVRVGDLDGAIALSTNALCETDPKIVGNGRDCEKKILGKQNVELTHVVLDIGRQFTTLPRASTLRTITCRYNEESVAGVIASLPETLKQQPLTPGIRPNAWCQYTLML